MKQLLKRKLISVTTEDTILSAVQLMRDSNVSSVLVVNADELVVGIITERDIVQKFTLLDVQDKLLAKAGVLMSRPVLMAHIDNLEKDVKTLFFEKGIRHFPVTSGRNNSIKAVLGIMTVTDLATAWLKQSPKDGHHNEFERSYPVVVVCESSDMKEHYRKILLALRFSPIVDGDSDSLVTKAFQEKWPLLLDIDSMQLETVKRYLQRLKTAESQIFLLLSSQPQLVQPLREHLKGDGHFVVQKPLDISYLLQLLNLTQDSKLNKKVN